jgi:hypothetical protein
MVRARARPISLRSAVVIELDPLHQLSLTASQ